MLESHLERVRRVDLEATLDLTAEELRGREGVTLSSRGLARV